MQSALDFLKFMRAYVCMWVGGKEEERTSGYFQLRPYSYLMVFIGAKG